MLEVNLLNKKFKTPLLPASGPLSDSLESLKFFNENSVGAIVTKTISVKKAEVNKPCIVGNKFMIYNTELWSEKSFEYWDKEIFNKINSDIKKPLIISVGYSATDFETLIPTFEKYADFFEVSTHYNKDELKHLVTKVCSLTNKPVFIKLSPHISNYIEFTRDVLKYGASGIVAVNSVGPATSIDLKNRALNIGLSNGQSWISGPAIKPIALQRVMDIRNHFKDIPIIACGGVKSAKDVLEFILAGADLVQMLSSAMIEGKQLYDEIIEELPKVMKEYNIESIESLRNEEIKHEVKKYVEYPKIDLNKCTNCMLCIKICPAFAMKKESTVVNLKDKCMRCGLCESRCPFKAISGVL